MHDVINIICGKKTTQIIISINLKTILDKTAAIKSMIILNFYELEKIEKLF